MDFRTMYFKEKIENGTMTRESYVEMRLKEDKYFEFIKAFEAFEACESDKKTVVEAMMKASGTNKFEANLYYDTFRFYGTCEMRKEIKDKVKRVNEEFERLIG